jgi:hypothetical protein
MDVVGQWIEERCSGNGC